MHHYLLRTQTGISSTSTLAEIRKAYKLQSLKHHPDKVCSLAAVWGAYSEDPRIIGWYRGEVEAGQRGVLDFVGPRRSTGLRRQASATVEI